MENIGKFPLLVMRHGNMSETVQVRCRSTKEILIWNLISHSRVETIDGSANEGSDYVAVNEVLTFGPQETEQTVSGAGFNFLEKPGML